MKKILVCIYLQKNLLRIAYKISISTKINDCYVTYEKYPDEPELN